MPSRPSSGGRGALASSARTFSTWIPPSPRRSIRPCVTCSRPPAPPTVRASPLSATPSLAAAIRVKTVESEPVSRTSVAGRPLISTASTGTLFSSRTGNSASFSSVHTGCVAAQPGSSSGSKARKALMAATMGAARPDVKGAIRARALELGFQAIGFAPAQLGPEARIRLAAFLNAGFHGEMGWLETRAEQRTDPKALWSNARSVISLGVSYAPEDDPLALLGRHDRGAISVYARGRDYHDVVKGMLKTLAGFIAGRFGPDVKVFVDTAPVMEKPLAQKAGLGWQGKHTNLVSRAHGSWLFLGEIMTTADLAPDAPHVDRCGSCSRCLSACPTNAFPAPYQLDATRCISYLTIEHAGPIPVALRPLVGNRIYGCGRLPRRMPLEPLRAGRYCPPETPGQGRFAGAGPGGPGCPGRRRVPTHVRGRPDKTHRTQPLRA